MNWHVLNQLKGLIKITVSTAKTVKRMAIEQAAQRRMLEHIMSAEDNIDKAIADLNDEAGSIVEKLGALQAQVTADAAAAGVPQDKVQGWADQIEGIVTGLQSKVAAVTNAQPSTGTTTDPSTTDDSSKAGSTTGGAFVDPNDPNIAKAPVDSADVKTQNDAVKQRSNTDGGLASKAAKGGGAKADVTT